MQASRPTEDDIRQRAYEIYRQHGRQHGHDIDDWLQAEYDLLRLPIRKIAELKRPKPKKGEVNRKSLSALVRAALSRLGDTRDPEAS